MAKAFFGYVVNLWQNISMYNLRLHFGFRELCKANDNEMTQNVAGIPKP